MDESVVPAIQFDIPDDTAARHAHLLGLRATPTSRRSNVPETANREAVRPVGRPVRFEWDDHTWSESLRSHERPKAQRTDLSTVYWDGNVASAES